MTFTPTEYEVLIQQLHQRLIDDEGFDGVEVEHDIKLIGESGASYQIDVCWRLKVAGVEQLYCVECKYWKSSVKKEHVASFQTALNDLGGAKGVFVTTKGFQKGAKLLAARHKITLICTDVEIVTADAELGFVGRSQHDIVVDFERCDKEASEEILNIQQENPNAISVFDEDSKNIGTLANLLERLSRSEEGYYSDKVDGVSIFVSGRYVKIENIRFYQEVVAFPCVGLYGSYEVANVVAKYILEDREISASLYANRGGVTELGLASD